MAVALRPRRSHSKEDRNSTERIDNREERKERRRSRCRKRAKELSQHVSRVHALLVPLKRLGCPLERCSQRCELLPRTIAVPFVESLIYAWNHDRCITGVFSRCVNRMAEPRTMRQSLRHNQRTFGI